MSRLAMTYPTTLIIAPFLCSTAAATEQEVTCESPSECSSAHGKGRSSVKNDPSIPPTDASAIQSVTLSDIFSWVGPDIHFSQHSERAGIENNWFAVTGGVVDVRIQMDGDLHIACKTRRATLPASLPPKYWPNRNGAKCAKRFLAGRGRAFHFTLALQRS